VVVNNDSTIFRPSDNIRLKYYENNITISFSVVDFERNNYQFAYRLNETDPWTAIGDQRTVSFNNLSTGSYLVELSALGQPGSQKLRKILIVITAPFWARTWFIISMAVLTLAIAIWLVRLRMKRLKQRANIDQLLSQSEMKALQSQMNPHFIFNSLNSIREMILNHENKDASHYLSKFAQLIRITLDQSTQEMVSLRATIDYLERYIEMETIRNGFITYQFSIDNDVDQDETLVSPMMIQPFVENAIWHGVSASRKDITVRITFRKKGDSLICTVDDDGIGITHARSLRKLNGHQRRSHGIANVENRIALLNEKYNLHGRVTIIDKRDNNGAPESGTLVTIELPFQTTEI
jgi:LytS/YehU family sensor histidine kinase